MTEVTDTVGTTTTVTSRTFTPANQLQTSYTPDEGTHSFWYDDNGNLVQMLAPTSTLTVTYAYNQRNLLLSQTETSAGIPQPQASFRYDGANNRVQQIDHTAGIFTEITYTNDTLGSPKS